jgi:hypothetical protein
MNQQSQLFPELQQALPPDAAAVLVAVAREERV